MWQVSLKGNLFATWKVVEAERGGQKERGKTPWFIRIGKRKRGIEILMGYGTNYSCRGDLPKCR